MPLTGEGYRSPRDAIRAWLSKADNGSGDHLKGRDSTHNIREAIAQDGKVSHPGARRASAKHTTANLAERLKLEAPFRTLASVEHGKDGHNHSEDHQRKRIRRSALASSYLEPAAAAPTDRRTSESTKGTRRRETKRRYRSGDSDVQTNSNSISSGSSVGISKIPAKTYERRPRRKTREDRYEPKLNKNTENKSQKDGRRSSQRKRKHKSGARLTYGDDDAKSVSKSRLTLRPAQSLGLFKKGKASSPVRRGLPDLAFSEMTFLLARRDKSKELSKPAGEKKRREKDKATDAEEEISRFFTSRKHPLTEIDPNLLRKQPSAFTTPSHMARGRGKSTLPEASASRQSSKPPFELPDKPFLGFGNRGAPPISPLKNLDPVSKTTPSAAPSEMGHALSKRSSTYFTGSSNGIRSEVPDRKRLKNTAPLLGSPEVSVSFNQAMPSIEVGQLGQTGLHKMRPPDKQPQLLHKQPPGRRSLLIEGLDRLHSSNGSQSRQSSLALSAHGPQEAVETWNNREKPVKLIENDGDDPSQPLVETAELRTKSKTQDDKPRPSKSQDTLSHSGKRKDQLQSLSSLLRDCEATLSNLISTECDPSALQQGKRSDKSRSRSANARNNLRSRPEEVFTDCNAEEPEPLSDGLSTTTPRRSYKSPTKEFCPTIVGNQSFRRDQGGLSRVQLNADHLPPPAHQADQGHPQSQVPTYNATVLFRNTGDIEGYVHHNTEDPADLAIRDTQPQSPGAYYVADPRQYARNHYLFEAPGEDGSTGDGEVGNLRHPIRFDEWDPRNTPHDFENSQLDNIYKNSPVSLQDLGISSENLKDHCGVDSFPGREVDHVNTYLDVNMDRQGNGYPFVSASDHEEDHSLWVNEYAEGLPETVLPVNVLNDDLLGTCDRHTRRAESRAGHSMEIDEMPMTKFWRPHRLY